MSPSSPAFPMVKTVWPDPSPIADRPVDEDSFPLDGIPDAISAYIEYWSTALQVPRDTVAVLLFSVLSHVVRCRFSIQLQATWEWFPNIWGLVCLPSGTGKSQIFGAAIGVLKPFIDAANEEFAKAKGVWQSKQAIYSKLRDKKLQEAKNSKTNAGLEELEMEIRELDALMEEGRPKHIRYVTNDSTAAMLEIIARDNPDGFCLARDELSGLLCQWINTDRLPERQLILEGFNGVQGYTTDRVGRGTTIIESFRVTVFGCVQPSIIGNQVSELVGGKAGDDGFFARFQAIAFHESLKLYEDIQVDEDPTIQERIVSVIANILGKSDRTKLLLQPLAAEIFNKWNIRVRNDARKGELADHIATHVAKEQTLVGSLAAILEVFGHRENDPRSVSAKTISTAIGLANYFRRHAVRFYEAGANKRPALLLAQKIAEGSLTNGMTVSAVSRRDWSGLDKKSVRDGLALLESLGWVRIVENQPGTKGGRPSEVVFVNPKTLKQHAGIEGR